MSRRNQPYLPLYVQDFLTDEKLIECSASATGIYARLMCIMHKSNPYGTILLKQKDKQTENICLNFALKLAKQMPYEIEEIQAGLAELISEEVIILNENKIYQKRMVHDEALSLKRSEAGKKGGKKTQKFAKAKVKANTEDENEYENEDDKILKKEEKFKSEVYEFLDEYPEALLKEFISYWTEPNKSKTKLRYELEKTWDLGRRLNNWASRSKEFVKKVPEKQTFKSKNFEEIIQDKGGSGQMPESLRKLAEKKKFK